MQLHAGICRSFHPAVSKLSTIFPFIEASRPRSKSGIQALCSLHVALDKAKGLLQHCADSSRLYLVTSYFPLPYYNTIDRTTISFGDFVPLEQFS